MEAAQATRSDSHTERLHAALEELARDRSTDRLVGIAAARWRHYDRATIEDALATSIEHAYSHCRGETAGAVYRWLEQDLGFRLLNVAREQGETRRVIANLAGWELAPDQLPGPEEAAYRAANAQLAAELLSDFSPRDQNILRLAWGEREKRPVIAEALGISEWIVRHTLRRARRSLQQKLCEHIGGGCGHDGEQLVRALAFSHHTRDSDQALAHMHNCQACTNLYDKLDQIRLGAAALTPTPMAAKPSVMERAHERVAGAADWTREQLTSAYTRAHEFAASPPPLRPGAALATLGVCAATAGGGYCIQQGVSPLGVLPEPAKEEPPADKPDKEKKPRSASAPSASATPTPAPSKAPAAPSSPRPSAPPRPTPTPSQAAPSPAGPTPDFDIEQTRPSTPRTPAAAPTQGGGEFF